MSRTSPRSLSRCTPCCSLARPSPRTRAAGRYRRALKVCATSSRCDRLRPLFFQGVQDVTKRMLPSFAALLLLAAAAHAQGQQDFSQVQIKTTKLANNFYALDGQGGTIGVLAGPDGVFMVDAQFAPLSEKIMAAIKQISDGRIRFLVNTHVHGDHTGGNE